jgi:hypothetical protein
MAVCGLPSLVAAMTLRFTMPESPKFLLERGDNVHALEVLRKVFVVNKRRPGCEYPVIFFLSKQLDVRKINSFSVLSRDRNPFYNLSS